MTATEERGTLLMLQKSSYLPLAAISRRELLHDGGLMPVAVSPRPHR